MAARAYSLFLVGLFQDGKPGRLVDNGTRDNDKARHAKACDVQGPNTWELLLE